MDLLLADDKRGGDMLLMTTLRGILRSLAIILGVVAMGFCYVQVILYWAAR